MDKKELLNIFDKEFETIKKNVFEYFYNLIDERDVDFFFYFKKELEKNNLFLKNEIIFKKLSFSVLSKDNEILLKLSKDLKFDISYQKAKDFFYFLDIAIKFYVEDLICCSAKKHGIFNFREQSIGFKMVSFIEEKEKLFDFAEQDFYKDFEQKIKNMTDEEIKNYLEPSFIKNIYEKNILKFFTLNNYLINFFENVENALKKLNDIDFITQLLIRDYRYNIKKIFD